MDLEGTSIAHWDGGLAVVRRSSREVTFENWESFIQYSGGPCYGPGTRLGHRGCAKMTDMVFAFKEFHGMEGTFQAKRAT